MATNIEQFRNRYAKPFNEGDNVITFYGDGGIGKTALLKQIEDELIRNDCPYVKYDFNAGTDSRQILNTLKFQLEAYCCEFPLFDTGNFYYSLAVGQDITPLKARSIMNKIPWLNRLKESLSVVNKIFGDKSPIPNTENGALLEMADDELQALPCTRVITACFSVVDTLLLKYMEHTEFFDKAHQNLRYQLNERVHDKNLIRLYNFLPTLFAQDVEDFIEDTGNKLVVIFDNFDALTRDLWLRELTFMIPDTLWTIAGRNKLSWDDEPEQHLITALSPDESDFLDDEKIMLEYLCVLDVWTDKMAIDIGEKSLHNFNRNTYERVKNFSFIQETCTESDDFKLTFYTFDRTLQSILVAACDEKLIADVKAAVDDYFKNLFADKKSFDAEEIFCLKLWANFIVRFVDDADTLRKEFDDKLSDYVHALTDLAEFDAAEDILNMFTGKLEIFGETDGLPRADFELEISRLHRALGNGDEAYELAKSAYEKRIRLLGDEHPGTLEAINILAVTLVDIHCEDEALPLRERAWTLSKKIFGDKAPETLKAMNNFAYLLMLFNRDEALTLCKQTLTLCRQILGDEPPDTLFAMNNLAWVLNCLARKNMELKWKTRPLRIQKRGLKLQKRALALRERVLTLSKKIFGDESPETLEASDVLAEELMFSNHEVEALKLKEQALTLSKKIFGEEHPDTLFAMKMLASELSIHERYEEALPLCERVLTLYRKILGEAHPYTLHAVDDLDSILSCLDRDDEQLKFREQTLTLHRKIFGDISPETLRATNRLAGILGYLKRYDEAITLLRDTFNLYEETLGDAHPMTIDVMANLAEILNDCGEREEAIRLIERAADSAQEIFGNERYETEKIINLREKILHG